MLAALPIKTKISRYDSQPSGETGAPIGLELQQSPKTILSQSLADMEVTIRRGIVIRCARTSCLVQGRAVRLKELRPRIAARIRRAERFQKRRNPAITHSLLQTGRIQPELMPKFTSGPLPNLLRIRPKMLLPVVAGREPFACSGQS